MKYAGLALLSVSLAFAPAALAEDEFVGNSLPARSQPAVTREAPRPVAARPRAVRMPQTQQPQQPMAGVPQQRFGDRDRGMRRGGMAFGAGANEQPRVSPRGFNAPAVEAQGFTPRRAANTAPITDPMGEGVQLETGPGRLDTARPGAGRGRIWGNRDAGSNGIQTAPVNAGSQGVDSNTAAQSGAGDAHHRNEHRSRGWKERHREWHERHEGDPDFADKHRRYHRQHYNRDWWRRNYSRFVLFGGGYYYWNRGYWYPAYGYDPYYSTYTYDAPLYSYDGLSPAQVIGRVQGELQRRGYYRGAVDGSFGPATRQALMNYQADVGLPMTGEIDEETLSSFGLR